MSNQQKITQLSDNHEAVREYRVEVIAEKGAANILFGESKLPIKKIQAIMNQYGLHGWRVAHQVVDRQRFLLFWQREVLIITFER